jgi:endonuclease III
MTKQQKAVEILNRLHDIWPLPKTALIYTDPLQLLVATILSAQTTDKLVNMITPALFARFPTAKDYADSSVEEIDSYIKKTNFHNNKARNIYNMAKILSEKYNGKVPDTIEELITLPGVARKTANVVLGSAFGKSEGIAVDTHVMRLSKQLGLTEESTPEKIEKDLMSIVPKDSWTDFSLLLINYGRAFSPARIHCKDSEVLGDLCN